MYDAKKEENIRDKHLQYDCIGERNYYCICNCNNMVDMRVSFVPVEIIIKEFN